MRPVKPSIGGQAVIEGVMMRGPKYTAIAVRKKDGEIVIKKDENYTLADKYKFFKLPILRGILALFEMMIIGFQALSYSASVYEYEDQENDLTADEREKENLSTKDIAISFLIAICFTVLLFIVLPTFGVKLIAGQVKNPVLLNLIEGIFRIIIFIIYIVAISSIEDVRRVFEYHGAEHKAVFCYENNEKLIPENAQKYTTLHPRCGTSFLMIVMIVSLIIFSLFGWPNIFLRIVSRILMMPIVAGVSYEVIRVAGNGRIPFMNFLIMPGIWLQKLTTKEPDKSQLDVALAALKSVI